MSKIFIDNYRGFDIEFETINEKFQCVITDELVKESISFSAIKKFIDEYKKQNQNFKPFFAESIPSQYTFNEYKKIKIVGIRKDGRFIAENSDGVKFQVSDFDIKDYMLYSKENEKAFGQLLELKLKEQRYNSEIKMERSLILSTIKVNSLADFKKTL